ncbi:MAG: cation transporter, partial [Methylovirgula sp.]
MEAMHGPGQTSDPRLTLALRFVVILNLVAFCVEFVIALSIDSVSLFADSVDFLEDLAMGVL